MPPPSPLGVEVSLPPITGGRLVFSFYLSFYRSFCFPLLRSSLFYSSPWCGYVSFVQVPRTHTYTHIDMYLFMFFWGVCVLVLMLICSYVHASACACMYSRSGACMYARTLVLCTHTHIYKYIGVPTYILYIHTYSLIYIYLCTCPYTCPYTRSRI